MSNDQSESTIFIVNPIPDEKKSTLEIRGPADVLKGFAGGKAVNITDLSKNAESFFKDIATIFKDAESHLKNYQLEEIELTVTITSSGKFSLFAASAEGGLEGGIKLLFKRAVSTP